MLPGYAHRDRNSVALVRVLRDFTFLLSNLITERTGIEEKKEVTLLHLFNVVVRNLEDEGFALAKHFHEWVGSYNSKLAKAREYYGGRTLTKEERDLMLRCWIDHKDPAAVQQKFRFHHLDTVAASFVRSFKQQHAYGHSSFSSFGKESLFPCQKESLESDLWQKQQAEYIGAKQVPVSKGLFGLLTISADCPTLDSIFLKKAELVRSFPDWVPTEQEIRWRDSVVAYAMESFGDILENPERSLRFKVWPEKPTNYMLVVPISKGDRIDFIVDPVMMRNSRTIHSAMTKIKERCLENREPRDFEKCTTCQFYWLRESLKHAILKDKSISLKDLDRAGAIRQARGRSFPHPQRPERLPKSNDVEMRESLMSAAQPPPTKKEPSNQTTNRSSNGGGEGTDWNGVISRCVWQISGMQKPLPAAPLGPVFLQSSCSTSEKSFIKPTLGFDKPKRSKGGLLLYRAHNNPRKDGGKPSEYLAEVLGDIASNVFGWPKNKTKAACCVYWEERDASGQPSQTFAFNDDGKLFFNSFFFWEKCHYEFLSGGASWKVTEQGLGFWFTTFCHELAHYEETLHNQHFAEVMGSIMACYLPAYRRLTVHEKHEKFKMPSRSSGWGSCSEACSLNCAFSRCGNGDCDDGDASKGFGHFRHHHGLLTGTGPGVTLLRARQPSGEPPLAVLKRNVSGNPAPKRKQ
jgi:hypothetical protein